MGGKMKSFMGWYVPVSMGAGTYAIVDVVWRYGGTADALAVGLMIVAIYVRFRPLSYEEAPQ